jgi:hypothetical protein
VGALRLIGLTTALTTILFASSCSAQAAERFVAPTGSDSASCSAAAPCASLVRAYRVAASGDTITIAPGSYARQELLERFSKPRGAPVLVRPAAPGTVTLEALRVEVDDFEVDGLTVGGWHVYDAKNVVLRSMDVQGGIFISSSDDVRVLGGSVGPGVDFSPQIKASSSAEPPRNVVIDGVTFHDWVKEAPGSHVDCLHVMAADGLVIRNSRFRNCEAFSILFTKFGAPQSPRNVVIENNFFDCCRSGFFSVQLGGGHGEYWENFLVRFNSANKGFSVGSDTTDANSNVRFDSNVLPSIGTSICSRPGVEWTYNVAIDGPSCGLGSVSGPSPFTSTELPDFHLRAASSAIDAGNPGSHPARDIYNGLRPAGGAPDAGAHEWGAVPGSPDPDPPPAGGGAPGPVAPPSSPTSYPSEPSGSGGSPRGTLKPARASRTPVLASRRLRIRGRRLEVRLRCPGRTRHCDGLVKARLGGRQAAALRVRIQAGGRKTIRLRLPSGVGLKQIVRGAVYLSLVGSRDRTDWRDLRARTR